MKVAIFKVGKNCYAICRVTGVRLEAEIFTRISSIFCNANLVDQDFQTWADYLSQKVHATLLKEGDKQELFEKFGNLPFSWYHAGCELTLLKISERRVKYHQIGTTHILINGDGSNSLAVPVHNIAQEINSKTIESSMLRPFENRNQRLIADQLLYGSPTMITQLASLPRAEFLRTVGHCRTRNLGFFPQVRDGTVRYSKQIPKATIGEFELPAGNSIYAFFPPTTCSMQYRESKVLRAFQEKFVSNAQKTLFLLG